ncbi:uncharacterized protein LOC141638248 [Silene latifolia]|uniref:uncharacterized protein LOC141638248 n=1 Tax=Silene latifolia TaxID=37657 RepID=UPI003D787D19
MKCRSVVGIWPETPPSHRITAVAVAHNPPSIYTGAADGSIFWWHFSANDSSSSPKIIPVAILCSHAAPVVDLCLCYPLLTPSDENVDHEKDLGVDSSNNDQAALVSACSDGVLCLWSRGSGHCRRRRKLPPWAGSPSMVQMLPSNRRYLCVASCFSNGLHASDHEYVDYTEGNEVIGDQESFCKKATKCTIVIVDSYTLTIVQTVFHGHLSIGPLKYMTIIDPVDDKEKSSALIVDSYGNIQLILLVEESNLDKEGGTKLHSESSRMNIATVDKGSCEGGLVVYVTSCGLILGLVYETQCVIMLLPSSTVIGVIPFENIDGTLSHIVGGMFISSDISCGSQPGKIQSSFEIDFVVWDEKGFAIVYKISFVHNTFKYEVICEIPACVFPFDVKICTNFVQLGCFFLRVESLCLNCDEPLLWRPRFTIWSLHQHLDGRENIANTCKLLGESDFLINGIYESNLVLESEASELIFCEKATAREGALTSNNCAPGQEENITLYKDDLKSISVKKEHIVSSSMIISQNVNYPYALVYGYHNGDIELVQFNMLTQKPDDGVTLNSDMTSVGSKQLLSGHTGAVLCLAAHQMVVTTNDQSYRKVLLSGSMDCTLRVWDLDTGSPVMVMHHHVAAVRQIVLPPFQSDHPWDDCFLSVGEDSCVALVSLSTLRAERIFPGHPTYPGQVIWDSVRGYLACLSQNNSVASSVKDVLYIWDIKAGSRERVLRGTAAHSMFSNFCRGMNISNISGCAYNTSNTSFDHPLTEDGSSLPSKLKSSQANSFNEVHGLDHGNHSVSRGDKCVKLTPGNHDKVPIRCYCPNSGITILSFDLSSLLSVDGSGDQSLGPANDSQKVSSPSSKTVANYSSEQGTLHETIKNDQCVNSFKLCLLRFSLSLLHLWGVDCELDNLLMMEMNVKRYENLMFAPGLEGDRGSITLAFPAFRSTLQLWKSSSEFCALRSLIMVSLAQCMVSLCNSCSGSSSALSAFYTRHFAEKVSAMKPPSLQLLVSFWQDEDEHVRMAARSLFHCAASRAIPPPLFCPRTTDQTNIVNAVNQVNGNNLELANKTGIQVNCSGDGESAIINWMNSYELHDWISCVGGTSQDAMASHIIVAAALAIWYPSLVKPTLAMSVVHPLIKLVMAMNEKYSSAAAELLAEGMDSTWKACLGAEIHRLIEDVFFQIECVSGGSKLRETLVTVLLPSLAMGDIPGFLGVIEGLIWSTASDSSVHLVSLKTIIRLMRGSPRNLAQFLNKVVNFILQTIDPANSVMRRTCLQSSMATLREVVRVYPMIALNDTSTQLAVGDAISEVNSASIHVYDMQSVTKIKVLDASGPPGLPTLLSGPSETVVTAISALSFSPDEEGLVAFSEHGLIIRWWSLGTAWWEKLSRNLAPVRCTKLIFVPPWEGFSPNSSRGSIMANIAGSSRQATSQCHLHSSNLDSLNLLLYSLDLSYRLEWVGNRKVRLLRHGHEIETFLM